MEDLEPVFSVNELKSESRNGLIFQKYSFDKKVFEIVFEWKSVRGIN